MENTNQNNSENPDNSKNSSLDNLENPLIQVQTTDWNKERLAQLKNLMPDLFTNDGQLNINELKKVVDPGLVTETERYEFRWFGKSNAKREAFTPTDATLVYDENRSVNPTESDNLIIEGENLAVLKLLSNSYREQVKCIYIDPPYNTGNDFVYSDKFNQDKKEYWEDAEVTENGLKIDTNTETDGRFHSNWLNMMYSRLLIARQLLKEDGVINIQIDDNEYHHLKKICDEVFGEENFISTICVKMSHLSGMKMAHKEKKIPKIKEFILLYAKNREAISLKTVYTKGDWSDVFDRYNSYVDINYDINENEWQIFSLNDYIKSQNLTDEKEIYKFKIQNGSKIFRTAVNDSLINESKDSFFRKIKTKTGLEKFIYKGEEVLFADKKLVEIDGEIVPAETIGDIWTDIGINNLHKEGDIAFENGKKPLKLLKRILNISAQDNDLILDFFAGSGTTGQAVTELNQEDGGNRKYILVQLPEATESTSEAYKAGYKKISDITIERNKRVVEKIQSQLELQRLKDAQNLFGSANKNSGNLENSKNSGSDNGLGFKVFKLQKSNFPRVEYAPDPEKTHEENVEALKKYIRDKEAQLISAFNKEELITEIVLKNGFKLNYTSTKQEQFTKNEILFVTDGDKETLICLDGDLAEETVEHFKKHTEQKLIVLERALDTTKKWNLKHYMKDNFKAF
jgi:adenine-specific DNA-methyltransferase